MKWLTRIVLTLVVVAILGAIGFRIFQKQILWRMFDRGVELNLTSDFAEDLPDGLHVFMCGTGSPMPDNKRAGACLGVLAGEQAFIFDTGSGAIRKLSRMGFPMGKMQSAFLTHLHSDHIDGLGEMLLMAWIGTNGFRNEPLPVYGPVGTEKVLAGFNSAYELDRGYRIAHHGAEIANFDGYGGRAIEIELPIGPSSSKVVYDKNGVKISAIKVNHAPIEPAFGYRIDYRDRSVSFSGDTVYHPGFVAASKDVDVMFHEALDPEMVSRIAESLEASGRDITAKLMHDILDYHASPEDAARAAAKADASELVYYHLVPPLPSRILNTIWLGEARKEFKGKITVGEDGMLVSLPAGSDQISYSRRF